MKKNWKRAGIFLNGLFLLLLPLYAYQSGQFCEISLSLCPSAAYEQKVKVDRYVEESLQQSPPFLQTNRPEAKRYLALKAELQEKVNAQKLRSAAIQTLGLAVYLILAFVFYRAIKRKNSGQ